MSLATAVLTSTFMNETEFARELPIPTFMYGVIALIVFFALGAVTYSYRDVANRHRAKAAAYAARHGGEQHGGH